MPPATGAEDTLAQLSMLVQEKGIPQIGTFIENGTAGLQI